MFVDASAIVAIFAGEPEADLFSRKIDAAPNVLMSGLTIYESTLALARLSGGGVALARVTIRDLIVKTKTRIIAIDRDVAEMALDAFERFGKGRHRAALNMGDCFSYACAKVYRVSLLCKGNDFIHTDIRVA